MTQVVEPQDAVPTYRRVAAFGGIYSNHLALAQAIDDAQGRGAEALFCLGDLGAFGPHPDRVFPLIRDAGIHTVRGNYDDSIARGLDDCQCGYTDPRDNHYARISYGYTLANTSVANRAWLDELPSARRFRLGDLRVLACHGSPRQTNEFLWESATPTHFLQKLATDFKCDVILGTHTGIHWQRQLGERSWYVNAGALGRPANDGRTDVWYAMLEADGSDLDVEFVSVAYDHAALADEMREERLPLAAATELGIPLRQGVYAAVVGPQLETRAEYRMLRALGADVVGMSTVPEVIAARHAGMRVLAVGIITDQCLPDALEPVDVPAILRIAAAAQPSLTSLLEAVLAAQ